MRMRFLCFLCFFISVSALASNQNELVVPHSYDYKDMSPKAFFELCESINTSQEIDTNSVSPSVLLECRENVRTFQTGNQNDSVEFESIWLSETEIDVTEQPVQVTYEIELSTDGSAFTQACMRIEPPEGAPSNQREYACFYNFVELSTPGHYVASANVTFDSNALPGQWSPTIYQTRNAENEYRYEEITASDMRNAGEEPDLTIANSNPIDSEAPELISAELSSYIINIEDMSVELDVKIVAEDLSGVQNVYLSIAHVDNAYRQLDKFVSLSTWTETEDGMFESEKSIEFDLNTPPGDWVINSIQLNDPYGNYDVMYTDELRELEFATNFAVENSNEIDAEPPVLESLEFSQEAVTVTTTTEYVTLRAVISDASVVNSIVAILAPPEDSGGNTRYQTFYNFERNGNKIIATKAVPFYSSDPSGQWIVDEFRMFDEHGNYRYTAQPTYAFKRAGKQSYLDVNYDSSLLPDLVLNEEPTIERDPENNQFIVRYELSNAGLTSANSVNFELRWANEGLLRNVSFDGVGEHTSNCSVSSRQAYCTLNVTGEWEDGVVVVTFRSTNKESLYLSAEVSLDTDEYRYINNTSSRVIYPFNQAAHIPDFDGDRKADIAVYRASLEQLIYRSSRDGSVQRIRFDNVDNVDNVIPVFGDFDNDAKSDTGLYQPSTNTWFIKRSSDDVIDEFVWGNSETDLPIPGDYDGDGITDVAVKSLSENIWLIRSSKTGETLQYTMGNAEDIPVAGDFDGDWITDIGVRQASGMWLVNSSSNDEVSRTFFGSQAEDIAVPADYDGDSVVDYAVRRPSLKRWFVKYSTTNQIYRTGFGAQATDIPIVSDYDGDGIADIAVRRPSRGQQFILSSVDNTIKRYYFGSLASDIPVAAPAHIKMALLKGEWGTDVEEGIDDSDDAELFIPTEIISQMD